jgi:hypothetical protein
LSLGHPLQCCSIRNSAHYQHARTLRSEKLSAVSSAAKACSRRVLCACGGAEGLKVRVRISSQLMDLQFVSCVSLKRAPSPISSITLHTLRHVSSLRTRPYSILQVCPARVGRVRTGFEKTGAFCLPSSNGWRILVMLARAPSCFAHASW